MTLDEIIKWRDDAIKDDWVATRTYPSHESMGTACSLKKGAWEARIISRNSISDAVHVWDDKGIAVEVPTVYSWDALQQNLRKCGECNVVDAPTRRVGFANRVCDKCLESARKKYEYKGWTN